jgi:putative transposase
VLWTVTLTVIAIVVSVLSSLIYWMFESTDLLTDDYAFNVRATLGQRKASVVVRRPRNRVGSSTVPPVPSATGPNMVWAIDFQFDSTTDGRPVKILSVVDEHTRECFGGLVERSITGDVLATELNRITATRGRGGPAVLRLDNGPEMIAAALAEWAGTRTGMLFIPPGEPWRNPFIESFNGRLRDECLN